MFEFFSVFYLLSEPLGRIYRLYNLLLFIVSRQCVGKTPSCHVLSPLICTIRVQSVSVPFAMLFLEMLCERFEILMRTKTKCNIKRNFPSCTDYKSKVREMCFKQMTKSAYGIDLLYRFSGKRN